jgi:cytidine deaminase
MTIKQADQEPTKSGVFGSDADLPGPDASAPVTDEDFLSDLVEAAKGAAAHAYAPYSGFHVGAALLSEAGGTFTGCNVENRSYGLTCCAERNAIFSAVASEGPGLRIAALAVVADGLESFPPCGACRQVILEFGPAATVVFGAHGGLTRMLASHLLPESF